MSSATGRTPSGAGRSQGGSRALIRIKHGTSNAYTVEAYGDVSGATDPNMAIQLYMGYLTGHLPTAWKRLKNGWMADGFE